MIVNHINQDSFSSTQRINIFKKNCLLFLQVILQRLFQVCGHTKILKEVEQFQYVKISIN